ncbi:histidine kinase dimerization/phospho-acceptor domain-containing protein [Desulfomonile tiedjei]|uniref:histidine kinase n=1 Tax=Desulfomonile tiedjei (strain ATCC 49306 / DSM 6799 / DCB-1) TaxID=706587 RepID=I4C6W7_DESTA|nr:histidine kinase dimerization/phospho-acceptor domain-containing protein [Desulfomonile tiedjei]AFM25308.1 signal transduction histidine kinase [Desulfomonile tiedjei DSM 6799]
MKDEEKTKDQLIRELRDIRRRLTKLEAAAGDQSAVPTHVPDPQRTTELVWDPDEQVPVLDEAGQDEQLPVPFPNASTISAPESDEPQRKSVTETGSFDVRWITMASFGKLIQVIPMPILLVDEFGTIEFANNAFLKLCLVSDKPRSFFSLFAEDSDAVRDMFIRLLTERRPQFREGLIGKGESKLWGRMHLRSMRFGHQRTILVLLEDLTAVKHELILNKKYRALVDIFPIGIAEFALGRQVKPDHKEDELLDLVLRAKITEANGTFATFYGLQNGEELKGISLNTILPRDHVHYLETWIEQQFAVKSFETAETGPDNTVRYFENTLVASFQEKGLVRFWVMKQDISERKRVQAELVEKIRTIDELYEHIVQSREAKVLAEHTARVAHELRQPLTIIGGFARRMAKESATGRFDPVMNSDNFQIIIKEVARLEKILRRLIDFTKHDAVSLRKVNPNKLIEYVVGINTWIIREKNLLVELDLEEDLGQLLLDPEKFEDMVRNLLASSLEASPPHELIHISTRVTTPGEKAQRTGELESKSYFQLKIHNKGEPICSTDLEKAFDPFVTTEGIRGAVGFALAKKSIEDHRGSISLTSDATGTLVTVWLPMNPLHQERSRGDSRSL